MTYFNILSKLNHSGHLTWYIIPEGFEVVLRAGKWFHARSTYRPNSTDILHIEYLFKLNGLHLYDALLTSGHSKRFTTSA